MRIRKFSIGSALVLAMFGATVLMTATRASAQTETVLVNFNGSNGDLPLGGLVFDAAGNLYGTTYEGGAHGFGTVFELTPKAGGGWTEEVLHSFGNGKDGQGPWCTLVLDAAGNLYGTATGGGANGSGIAFELSPNASGPWTEKLLHNFGNGKDGMNPEASLIFDSAGNLYGTTFNGGADGVGMVFELMPQAGGKWGEKVLHTFKENGTDGLFPSAGMVFDAAGNLYGTTSGGGALGYGTVFKLTPAAGGGWSEQLLHSFGSGTDGRYESSGVILDAAGNLYGPISEGGTADEGIVFELTSTTSGDWDETILHNFLNNDEDGIQPIGSVIFDAAGNLYGTTIAGGARGGGTVFKLTPGTGGSWTEQLVYGFSREEGSYEGPFGGLLLDGAGTLYGTVQQGGTGGAGTAFKLTP